MNFSKKTITVCQEHQPMLWRSYASQEEFRKDYRKFYGKQSKDKEFYHLLLTQLEKAISEGEIAKLKKLNNLISYTNNEINHETLRSYYDNVGNPIRSTNLIILASQHNKVEILEYLFGSDSAVLNNLTGGIGRTTILPEDKDGTNHDAFYYAIRSENITLLDLLINKWPDNYFASRQEELEEIIANAYHELKLRNVPLSDEIQYFVEDKLLDHRFFSTGQQPSSNADYLNKTKQRIQLLLQSINLIKRDYLDTRKVDGRFLYVIKFIAQNLHILKARLRSTYDRIPWEELEFCLVIFILSRTSTQQELNLFYHTILNKKKIMNYLENFANELRDEENIIKGDKLDCIPRGLPREEIVKNIIKNYSRFEGLYNDYHKIRDIYSLNRISDHIELAVSADAREDQGRYVIIRVLQVIGEHLKNTLESPKLSHFSSRLLVLSLSQNARKYIIELRDALSHAESLSKIMEIEENVDVNFFINIQDDLRKVGDVVADIFYKNRIQTIRLLLTKIVEIDTLDEIKAVLQELATVDLKITIPENFKTMKHEKLEKLIMELSDNIADKTNYENKLFDKINSIINSLENQTGYIGLDYMMGYTTFQFLNYELNHNNYTDKSIIKIIKREANKTLNNITEKIEPNGFKEIVQLSNNIFSSVKSRIQKQDYKESRIKTSKFLQVHRLIVLINSIIQLETGEIKWIEELKDKLNETKTKAEIILLEDKYDKQLELKVHELSSIVNKNSLSEFKNNKKLQALVKMFVLDIVSILGSSKLCLPNNILCLDDNAPVLCGKFLRNYLAHDNVLVDVLLSDPLIAVILNAKKLTQENIMKSKENIGKLVNDDPDKLRAKFDQDLETITNQERMFVALEEGHADDLRNCLEKGADIKGRSTINSWTALHFAAKGSISLEVIRFILDQNLIVNVQNNSGDTPLHIAAAHGRQDIVNYFLKQTNVDVDVKNNENETPLHVAVRKNSHRDIVEVLLKNKANIFNRDIREQPPLYFAIQNNRIDLVQLLLRKDLNFDINEIMGKWTALHLAALCGHLELLNFLVENGADVNATTDNNEVPLYLASYNDNLEVVSALILRGANVNARTIHGYLPLHCAIENGNVKMVNSLLKYGAYVNTPTVVFSPLHFAAHFGNLEILNALLNQGANIHAKCVNNFTPLYYATRNGHKEVVECLIHQGAQNNLSGNNNITALHVAVWKGYTDIAYLLIKHNAEVNAEDIDGMTVIHTAAKHGNKEIIDLLIKNKADVNARCSNGGTPLHFAIEEDNDAAIDFLIRNKADINARENDGFTPLHLAVTFDLKEIVKLLIANNACVNLEYIGNNIPQPLHVAIIAGHKEIVKILVAKGATINDNSYIQTPLHCAIEGNHKEVVELLIEKGAEVKAEDIDAWTLPLITGYIDIVETLLKNKAYDVNYRDSNNLTPLHLAAMCGHKKIVRALIKNGADVHAASINNEAPLLHAASNGFEEVVKILIAYGADVNYLTYNQASTPLHVAAIRGHYKVVKVLLDNKADIDINDNSNKASVRLAVADGHLEVVKILLQYTKVNIDAKDENGFTLLHIASKGTNLELVKYLVNEGSDINATISNGLKAIHLAAQNGFKECVEFFVSKGLSVNEPGILHCAARNGHVEIVNYLIEQHADVNAKDTFAGLTPMHLAAMGGYRAVIEVLLKNGAIYNEVNHSLDVPLKLTNNKDVVELLESTDKLFKAVKRNSCAEVQNYITAGAVVNAKNTEGVRPLHYAAWKGYDEVVRVLLQNKANPNVVDNNGLTPLHYAAEFSQLKVVKSLLSYYSVYNAVSVRGETPSDLTKNKSIAGLFRKVDYFFKNIEIGNSRVIGRLQQIRDIDTVKAIMCARNRENKTLVVAAMHSNFSKIQQLKEIAQGDISDQINKAQKKFKLEDYGEALGMVKDALRKRKDILGSDNPATFDIQKHIAEVLIYQGCYREALNLLEEILQKEKEMLGFDSKETLKTKSLLASVMDDLGKYEEAFNIHREVYQKQKEMLGPTDEITLMAQSRLAVALNRQEKHDEALNILRSVYDNLKSKDSVNALGVQSNEAMVLIHQGNHEEALHIYKDILKKQEKILPINHSLTLATLNNIGIVLRKQKKYKESLIILKDVLIRRKQILNSNHSYILKTQLTIADVLFDQHKWIGALKAYRECFDPMKAVFGLNHPDVLHILKQIKKINIFSKLEGDNPSEVLKYLQKNINIAANEGDVQTIQYFLEDGADANDKDDDGQTPLHYAISNGHADVVNILLKHGAYITSVTSKGNTPLHTASSKGYVKIADILLQSVSSDELNSFINAKTPVSGATSLHVAAQNGFLNIAVLLLKRGAIYNITNNEDKTPLDLCTNQNFTIILKLIEELFQDAKNGNMEIIDKLKVLNPDEYLAVTNARNDHNYTLLQVAITNKHHNVARTLSQMLKDLSEFRNCND